MADRSLLIRVLDRIADLTLHAFALAGGALYYLGHWQVYAHALAGVMP